MMDECSDLKLLIVNGEKPGTTFLVPEGEAVIGSGSAAGIVLRYEGVSRRHALLKCAAGQATIADLGSLNGTWINAGKIDGPTPLQNGDLLQFGKIKLRFYCNDSTMPTASIKYMRTPVSSVHTLPKDSGSTAGSGDVPREVPRTTQRISQPDTVTPWYRRGKTLLIGAGTIAAALGSILALWDRFFVDPADLATIKSVTITKRTPLADFPIEGLGKNLTLRGAAHAVNLEIRKQADSLPLIHVGAAMPTLLPPVLTQPAKPGTSAPTRIGFTAILTAIPKPTPAGTPSPAVTLPVPRTGTPTIQPTPAKGRIPEIPSENARSAVEKQLVEDGVAPDASKWASRSTTLERVDDKGQPHSPEQLAAELKQALAEIETKDGSQPSNAGSEPMGWTVAVGLDLEGVAGVPLLLTWSLDGVDVSESWRAENLAYRIVPSTQHDAGVAEIWVPDLKRTGAYNINVTLTNESKATIADEGQLKLPNE
ncbi:FHA domain-containing protein [Arthrobacter sp. ov118]|uniref:FHA domain-containing protein n=1 Tax=Arthrobacter sp. ov118 TaxID=1761747 RepID=UPI000B8706A4|nr:FHA domain-containing protein [Arthrobacter sp. ov118]